MLAQGAKRAHDLGNSGYYQFIPFYGLWLIFQPGDSGINTYGENPKEIEDNNLKITQVNQESESQGG